MDKIFNYLGLARRSGKLVIGTDSVIKGMQKNQMVLIFIGSDASSQTLDKIEKKTFFYKVPLINKYHSNDLSHAVGKKGIMVFGLTDKGFKDAILKELERGDHNEG